MNYQIFAVAFLLECMFVVCGNTLHHECITTSFNLAGINESLSTEDIISVVNNSGPLDCVSRCFQNSRCVGAKFVPSSGQCDMYAAYKTQTATSRGTSGDKYYIMEAKCGSPNAALSYTYRREDIITTEYSCGDGKAFLGTNDTLLCAPPSFKWTTTSGTCINEKSSVFNGPYLHAVDSGFTMFGTPTGDAYVNFGHVFRSLADKFDVVFVTPSLDYPLKILVNMPQMSVGRQMYNASIWTPRERDLASPFPFEMQKMFTMEILSTAAEFQCKVNGEMLFTFPHLLPRDSMEKIRTFGSVIIEKILLK